MGEYGKVKITMAQVRKRLHRPMEARKPGQLGGMAMTELQIAKEAADYWRTKYDELLKHIEHQNQYRRYLEREVFGGPTF